MEQVLQFLIKNGFLQTNNIDLANDKCSIFIHEDHYVVLDINSKAKMYSENLNIYWLIGMLTYYGYMDKNYKQ